MKKFPTELYGFQAAGRANVSMEPFDRVESGKVFEDALSLPPVASDCLIKDTQGAAILNVSKATWWRRVADGTMPQPIRIGSTTRWRLSEIAAAIEKLANERRPGEMPEMAARPSAPGSKSTLDHKHLRKKEDK